MISPPLRSASRPLDPALVRLLQDLAPGQRIRITQAVRVGRQRQWTATVEGAFRNLNYLATGLTTERGDDDDLLVAVVHFTKPNGELSSITLDEHSKIERG